VRCRTCGAASRASARFCDQCGSRLDGVRRNAASAPREAASIETGDRRIVTALFADLVDYVRLVAEHDLEDVRSRVGAALTAMGEAIEAFDGTREKFIGDAVFAVFGWPVGHDDDALRAAHCALAIRAALANLNDPPAADPLQVRIGLATGEVVAAPRGTPGTLDWSLTGPAVTTAARIQTLAQPGEILLDEATVRAARKGLAIEERGPQVLRGQSRPVRIARLSDVTRSGPDCGRCLRERERAARSSSRARRASANRA
jgi:class 3 adenylate cyclase